MRKILMMSVMFFLICNATFAFPRVNYSKVKKVEKKVKEKNENLSGIMCSNKKSNVKPSRQTCTVYYTSPSGITYAATASSGWLLSNDQNSMDKACEKASAALYQIIGGLY
jgi:outer membrane lipoprotein-sorting protein